MRTTVNIDNDILSVTKEIARSENTAVGVVISRLLRQALTGDGLELPVLSKTPSPTGFEPFPAEGVVVTNEIIDRLRDNEGI